MMHSRRARRAAIVMICGLLVLLVAGAAFEARTSWLQAEVFSNYAKRMSFALEPGPAAAPRYPSAGPYNQRMGYVDLGRYLERLQARGFSIRSQTRMSRALQQFIDLGGFPIYQEKTQAGLRLLDQHGHVAFDARVPARIYPSFADIPPLVVKALLFIENRELLRADQPRRNPAIEWDRLALMVPTFIGSLFDQDIKLAGGSTLATQIEKFRHSPGGQTQGPRDKLRQMLSASIRAYANGVDTSAWRRQIVTDYLNATPLSAQPGFGEVNGLGDGLFAWFGTEFNDANALLWHDHLRSDLPRRGQIFRQVLSLLLAQRRPSYYLLRNRRALESLADSHLRLLLHQGIIDPSLAQAALEADLSFRTEMPSPPRARQLEHNAAQAMRTELLGLLDVPSIYQLDRLDLEVGTHIDLQVQAALTDLLYRLNEPGVGDEFGIFGKRLLSREDSNSDLTLSLTLYERGEDANYLRVQTDNLDQPFNVSRGAKLDLGSTAKLRTLITYLEVIEQLYRELTPLPADDLQYLAADGDPLTAWVATTLQAAEPPALADLLKAALERRYSASPAEAFFTGGGVHRFANFHREDNGRIVTVSEAFCHSINLPFVRLMRDIVKYHLAQIDTALLDDGDHPDRRRYLERFADREGQIYLRRFHDELRGLSPDQVLKHLADETGLRLERLAVIFLTLRPDAKMNELAAFLSAQHPSGGLTPKRLQRLFESYAPGKFSLNDLAYLARLHPLKLWLGAYLQEHPQAPIKEIIAASASTRIESYRWLFKTRHKSGQDRRIRTLLEEEAFERIHEAWRRLGYPFESLVPSYATAIGSSADRPDALAELVGILINDGLWRPARHFSRLHFAAGTPFEAVVEHSPADSRQVLSKEIARLVREAMIDVVENGTGRRLNGVFRGPGDQPIAVGVKTGTGDHRRKSFDRAGRLTGSAALGRTATIAFFIGDRLFGSLMIYISGPKAADFSFTGSLPSQLLKGIAPLLRPLLGDRQPQMAAALSAPDQDGGSARPLDISNR